MRNNLDEFHGMSRETTLTFHNFKSTRILSGAKDVLQKRKILGPRVNGSAEIKQLARTYSEIVCNAAANNREPAAREEYNTLVIWIAPYDFYTLGRRRSAAACRWSVRSRGPERNVLPYLIATNYPIRLSPYHPPGSSRR